MAIVRVSGPQAEAIGQRLFVPAGLQPWESHRVLYGHVCDPGSGERVDEALLLLMRAPRSFTRETVVEFHCHGGLISVQRVLELVLASGARRDLVTASNEAIELLGAMADAWDSRPEAGPRGRPLVDGGQGEDDGDGDGDDALVEVDSAAPPRRSSRADRQAHEEPGGEGDELIEVDENGNPVEEGQA